MSEKKHLSTSFYILLFVTFIDFMGIGLVYPIFSNILFDKTLLFLPKATSNEMRGIWLGLLFAAMPFVQFFSTPIWGAISDGKGRKKPLLLSLSITILGHLTSLLGILTKSISLLLLSRAILGIGAGNISIVQAGIADLSSNEAKAKNFGLYAMAIGLSFTFGPIIGGFLIKWGYDLPFIFASSITFLNLLLAFIYFKETILSSIKHKLSITIGIKNLIKAFKYKNIRVIFICSFLTAFAWTYFMEFIPVYLITNYKFTPENVGVFYGSIGGIYAISAGLLIRPFLKRFKSESLFFYSTFFAAISLLTLPFIPYSFWIWIFVIYYSYIVAFLGPTSTAIISNSASKEIQGEVLGVLGSVNTASYALSALIAGVFVGMMPILSIWISGATFFIAAIVLFFTFTKMIFNRNLNKAN
ncbi:MAG: Tetracycline resistance protein, class B [Candidatus Anoxychlamydiales bacterium]|nr:Tetracycline resistance protein, class B [Candidatus Anoxychlamydiales bacterium]